MEKASSVSARWGTVRALKRIVSLSKTVSEENETTESTSNSAPEPDLKLSTRVKGGDRRTQQQQKLREAQAAAKSTKKRRGSAWQEADFSEAGSMRRHLEGLDESDDRPGTTDRPDSAGRRLGSAGSGERPGSAGSGDNRPGSVGKRKDILLGKKRMRRSKTERLIAAKEEQKPSDQQRLREKVADICYHCKQPGHWKKNCPDLTELERRQFRDKGLRRNQSTDSGDGSSAKGHKLNRGLSVSKVEDEDKANVENEVETAMSFPDTPWRGAQDELAKARMGHQATANSSALAKARIAKARWSQVKANQVVNTVITQELAVERKEQVKKTYSFLVKDYQPKYYYFECIFLVEKLILTGLLIFVPPGTVAQSYVATLTSFAFCVIQTKYMPYDAMQDNILKQLCEGQLLMTLIISIVLRTDLEEDAITEAGYDMILVTVNIVMMPGFLAVAAIAGLFGATGLLTDYVQKRRHIQLREAAISDMDAGQENPKVERVREEMLAQAQKDRQAKANKVLQEQIRVAKEKEKERLQQLLDLEERIESRELPLVMASVVDTNDDMRELCQDLACQVARRQTHYDDTYEKATRYYEQLHEDHDNGARIDYLTSQYHKHKKKNEAHLNRMKLHQKEKDAENEQLLLEMKNTMDNEMAVAAKLEKKKQKGERALEKMMKRLIDIETAHIPAYQHQILIEREANENSIKAERSQFDMRLESLAYSHHLSVEECNIEVEMLGSMLEQQQELHTATMQELKAVMGSRATKLVDRATVVELELADAVRAHTRLCEKLHAAREDRQEQVDAETTAFVAAAETTEVTEAAEAAEVTVEKNTEVVETADAAPVATALVSAQVQLTSSNQEMNSEAAPGSTSYAGTRQGQSRLKHASKIVVNATRFGVAAQEVAHVKTKRDLEDKRQELAHVRQRLQARVALSTQVQTQGAKRAELTQKQAELAAVREKLEQARTRKHGAALPSSSSTSSDNHDNIHADAAALEALEAHAVAHKERQRQLVQKRAELESVRQQLKNARFKKAANTVVATSVLRRYGKLEEAEAANQKAKLRLAEKQAEMVAMRQHIKNARFKKAATAVVLANRLGLAAQKAAHQNSKAQLERKRQEILYVKQQLKNVRLQKAGASIITARNTQLHVVAPGPHIAAMREPRSPPPPARSRSFMETFMPESEL